MKKILIFIILSMLLFAGCAANEDPVQETADTTATEETVPGLWMENSAVEQQTDGAVAEYDLAGKTYHSIAMIDDKLLLIEAGEKTQLTVLSGPKGVPTANLALNVNIAAQTGSFQPLYNGFVYYQPDTNQAVFLDSQLQTTDAVSLPKDLEGLPVFSADGSSAFYCVGEEIRAFDMGKKLQRLVKSHSCKKQTILGCYFDGKLLSCQVEDADGNVQILWISGQTGQTLRADDAIEKAWTYGDDYFMTRKDGTVQQRIFGKFDTDPRELTVSDGQVVSALALGGVLQWAENEEGKLKLSFYNLESGKKTFGVTLKNVGKPKEFLADRWNQCIWILTQTEDGDCLLRWNIRDCETKDKKNYSSALWTKDAPDEEGLAACQERVDALNSKHGPAYSYLGKCCQISTGLCAGGRIPSFSD